MSVYILPSGTDLNVVNDFTPLIGVGTSDVSFSQVLVSTDPQFFNTDNYSLNYYYGAGGYYFFNTTIATSNSTRGIVQINSPWFQNSSGTTPIGNTLQAFEPYNGNISFSAIANYPYNFNYWLEVNTFTFYYTSSLSFSPYDPEIQDPGAYFIAYFV
jgi:hypothetical protein